MSAPGFCVADPGGLAVRTGSRRIQDMYKNDSERADREQKDTGLRAGGQGAEGYRTCYKKE